MSVSLLSLVVTACGLALFGVSLFVSWKLCWIPWREGGLSPGIKESHTSAHLRPQAIYTELDATLDRRHCARGSVVKVTTPTPSLAPAAAPSVPSSPPPVTTPTATAEAAMKISHTSPDIPLEVQCKSRQNSIHGTLRMHRQITDPASASVRSTSNSEIGLVSHPSSFHDGTHKMAYTANAILMIDMVDHMAGGDGKV